MTRQTHDLGDLPWQFGHVPRRPFAEANVYDLPAVTEWLPATVPGNVRTDLLALGRIPDPFFGEQYRDSLWVEGVDWWYRCQVRFDPLNQGQRAIVTFAGIDYLSAIFINGREMSRHEGMFSPQTVEITGALQASGGEVELAVRLWGSEALPGRRLNPAQRLWQAVAGGLHGSWTGVYPDRSAVLKSQMSFGWDFAPPIRTMGIWDEVSLIITGSTFIAEAGVVTQAGPPSSTGLAAPADFLIELQLDSQYSNSLEASVSITPANFDNDASTPASFAFPIHLPAGQSLLKLRCHLPEAALWQPWDRGYPHLYHVTVTLIDPGGQPVDEITMRTGVRRVELADWQFSLNGQPEFMRGLNWVPADVFPGRLRPADYARLLGLARESGANLLRVWGGGLREKRAFYELCDESGLMIWQEFPFACIFLGSFPQDKPYLALVEQECGAMVRQLRSHPSLILWCGGNEFSQHRNQPLLRTLATLVRHYDGTRPFSPTSPGATASGTDHHNWRVWHGLAPLRTFQAESAQFLSEFGLQALPHRETLTAALPKPTHPTTWPTHHADLHKLYHYAALFNEQPGPYKSNPLTPGHKIHHRGTPGRPGGETQRKVKFLKTLCLCASVVQSLWPKSRSSGLETTNDPLEEEALAALIQTSQQAQATGLQLAIEHIRRRKSQAGGLCLWQLNEPWPAISWALIDYFGRPKLAYEQLSTWYNPILISLAFSSGRHWQPGETFKAGIWAINDSLQEYTNCRLQIILDGHPIHSQTLDLPANSVRQIGQFSHLLSAPPGALSLTLHQEDHFLCQNTYPLTWTDGPESSPSYRFRRWVADWVLW